MSTKGDTARGQAARIEEWLRIRATESAVYSTLVIGYGVSLQEAEQLNLVNFLPYTCIQILYGILAWWLLRRKEISSQQLTSGILVLSLLTVISGLFLFTGIGYNWLLYFVTIGVYFHLLPIRRAIQATILLYIPAVSSSINFSQGHFYDPNWLTLLSGFLFVSAFAYSNRLLHIERDRTGELVSQLRASKEDLESAHTQLQAYAGEVEELAAVRERTRLAREIHDILGHYLTILNIQLEAISKLQERDPARAIIEVAEARRVAAQSMQEIRNAVAALRPTSIATLNIIEALTQLGNEFSASAPQTDLTLDLDTPLPPLPADIQHSLYRAAQEALTNVRKHAQATKVLLRLRYEDGLLELVVRDNGRGLSSTDQAAPQIGFGLIGIRERIDLLEGKVSYGPVEPDGYKVSIQVPIPVESVPAQSSLAEKSHEGLQS